jgi:NifU-like protein involved in Fe-S cluster formation
MTRYVPAVQHYFRRPLPASSAELSGEAGSVRQGAWVRVTADRVSGQLQNVGFRVFACPHIIALCNRAAEVLEGAPLAALRELPLDEMAREFEIPVEKAGKLLILKDALAACYPAGEGDAALN